MAVTIKIPIDVVARVNISAKVVWAFFSLVMAADAASGIFETLIAFVTFSTPAWAHSGIRWVLGGEKTIPLWSVPVFGVAFMVAFYPVLAADHSLDAEDYLPALMVLVPAAFYLFRFLGNWSLGQNSIISDFVTLKGFFAWVGRAISENKRNAFYIISIIALLVVAMNNFHGSSGSAFDKELAGLRLDSIYGSAGERAEALKQIEIRATRLTEEKAEKTEQMYTIVFSFVLGIILIVVTAPLWRWRLYHAARHRIDWRKSIYIQVWANALTALSAVAVQQAFSTSGMGHEQLSAVVLLYVLLSWAVISGLITRQTVDESNAWGIARAGASSILWIVFSIIVIGLIIGLGMRFFGLP